MTDTPLNDAYSKLWLYLEMEECLGGYLPEENCLVWLIAMGADEFIEMFGEIE